MRKVICILSLMVMILGNLLFPFGQTANAGSSNGNTTNNDVIMDCSQCNVGVGEEKSISATISPANAQSLKWKVGNSAIIELVKKKGGTIKVIGLKAGTTTITAYHGDGSNKGNGNKSVTCQITVSPETPKSPTEFPKLEADMKAAEGEVLKPSNANAKGRVDITLVPKGNVAEITRQPVDVVLVFDKSGSMNNRVGNKNQTKLVLAQNAVNEAINIFKSYNSGNINIGDRLALVPFSDDIEAESKGVYNLTANTNNAFEQQILKKVNSLQTNGSTNYTISLKKASDILKSSTRQKYIIFLTDGMPTHSSKVEYVNGTFYTLSGSSKRFSGNKEVNYLLLKNNNGTWVGSKYFLDNGDHYFFSGTTSNHIRQEIIQQVTSAAAELGKQNVKLYTIGFGDSAGPNQEIDMNLLSNLSEITGAEARHGTVDNLNTVFRSVSEEISKLNMSEISLRLKIKGGNLGQNVQIPDGSAAYLEGDYAVLHLRDVPYQLNGGTPPIESYNLPLEFTKEGTYTFDEAMLEYKDLSGNPQSYRLPNPVTVVVRAQTEPTFQGTMSYSQQANNLVISQDPGLNRNTFTVDYNLSPSETLKPMDRGKMTDIKLVQALPEGVTVINKNDPGIVVISDDDGQRAEISFSSVEYKNGTFIPSASQMRQLQLSVDWALRTKLTNPQVIYKNNESLDRMISIQAPNQQIRARVELEDSRGFIYEGDDLGKISKINQQDNSSVDALVLASYPVKKLTYLQDENGLNNNVIRIEYQDVARKTIYVEYLPMIPGIELKKTPSQLILDEDDSYSNEDVIGWLAERIPDPNSRVQYKYRLTKDGSTVPWTTLASVDAEITMVDDGTYLLEVKGEGGFANGEGVLRRITVDKTAPQITIITPADKSQLSQGDITIQGQVVDKNLSSFILKDLNGTSQNIPIEVKADGSFTHPLTLQQEENVLVYYAVDAAGNESTKVHTLTLLKNGAPIVSTPIEDRILIISEGNKAINLSDHFTDPDKDPLTFTASSGDESKVKASIVGGELVLTPLEVGTAEVEVTANDQRGGQVTLSFTVSVIEANSPPTLVRSIDNKILYLGQGSVVIDLTEHFVDPNGDTLTFSVSPTNSEISRLSVEENLLTIDPLAIGDLNVTVTADDGEGGDLSTTFSVTVKIRDISLSINPVPVLKIDDKHQLVVTVHPPNFFNRAVEWSSNNPEIATVDQNGVVTAIKGGVVTITATSKYDPTRSASVEVTVFDFGLTQNGIVGDYVIIDVVPIPETVRDNTVWYKYDYANQSTNRDWIKIDVASKNKFTVGITLEKEVKENKLVFVEGQKIKVKAVIGATVVEKELPVSFIPKNPSFIDNSGIKIDIRSSTDGEGSSSSSGNRAARVVLSYRVILPEGIKSASFEPFVQTDGKTHQTPYYSIKDVRNNQFVLQGQMYEDGIGKFSTPVIKFLKSSTGYSQQFNVEAVVSLTLITNSGERLPFELRDDLKVTVYAREKLQ
ncbi:Ig-like domain-containing protein [Ammoniphilus sp. CFH 90114]|uniref:Ig-like domain-containing protein n=1 Tax=Ammoniphilus sp. CFH 90114 TaxID=2493665 RepID=UPI0013E92045|nr:Ig-like domain-containing protein [Ammoniphilus sp. CFH 90114]